MDPHFAAFLEEFGPAIDRRDATLSTVDQYRGVLPEQLLAYWQEHGWCGYGRGLFWTVDPKVYEPVLEAWIGETPFMEEDAYHIIARGAFGDIYFFGARTGRKLHVVAPDARVLPPRMPGTTDLNLSIRAFFASQTRAACEFSDAKGAPLFARALQKLGPLRHDEMYGFVPALALGGPATLDHLQKVKAVEHLALLAQLSPLRQLPE